MKYIKILLTLIIATTTTVVDAQEYISVNSAIERALENNFQIQLADNNRSIAEVNASKYNTGLLPTVALDGGAGYRLDNTTANFQDGRSTTINWAESYSANVSVGVGYTIFDGLVRKYNIEQLKARYDLSDMQVRAAMENVIGQTLAQYYVVAALSNNVNILEKAMNISRERVERATAVFDFGQSNKLEVLNAQVDLNNDSLSYTDGIIQLENAKRQLNNLMVDVQSVEYSVDSQAVFLNGLDKGMLRDSMLKYNTSITLIDQDIRIGNINIDLAKSRHLPTLDANASYAYSYNNNNSASFLASQNTNGLNLGLTARWNIFDGGATKVAKETARLNAIGLEIEKEQLINDLSYQFDVAWADYQNSLYVFRTEEKNLELNRANFERTVEQYKIGQVNSLDFRQAQINLLNAETRLNRSRFEVKVTEVALLLLCGQLL